MNDILRFKNILISVLIVFIFWMVINNILKKNSQDKLLLGIQEKTLAEGEKTIKKWQTLSIEYSKMQGKFLQKDILFFKKFVEESAKNFEIDIKSLNVSHSDKGEYWEAALQLRSASSYKNFVGFLKAIEKKRVQVESIRIAEGYGDVRTDLRLKGIVYK